jgi:methyl-accepting chemotaxis protein
MGPERKPDLKIDGKWRDDLLRMAEDLGKVSKTTEGEFLDVGRKLMAFSVASAENSAKSAAVVNMINSGDGFDTGAFMKMFGRVYIEIEAIVEVITGGSEGIKEIVSMLDGVSELKAFLEKLSRSIKVIGMMIRIETARSGSVDFNVMTDTVERLARQIIKGTAGIGDSASKVRANVIDVESSYGPCVGVCQSELGAARQRVNDILKGLDEMAQQARWLCERVSGRAAQVMPEIGGVVASIQSHDITRQQMEHVSEGLHDVIKEIGLFEESDWKGRVMLLKWISQAVMLQVHQLQNVINETNKAADNISKRLGMVADISEAQAEDAATILEGEESGRDRIKMVGVALDALTTILSTIKSVSKDMVSGIQEAVRNVNQMSAQVKNIDDISGNVNLLALNAIIKAAKAGGAGRGLGVLAEEISKVSHESKERIAAGSFLMSAIIDTAASLKTYLEDKLTSCLESSERIAKEARHIMESLSEDDEEIMNSMHDISHGTKKLQADIAVVIKSINFNNVIKSHLDGIIARLEELHGAVVSKIPDDMDDMEFTPDLSEMLKRYTMQSERAVHQSVTGKGGTHSGVDLYDAAVAADEQTGDGGLGDNVELF